ncbi:MAG: PH domain-containing protein, partial [Alphaproteobacteria bacterium]|nr:PH domain-containing protein [Alphaproteobacteria bacterium]
ALYWKSVAMLIFSLLVGMVIMQFGILFMIVGAIMLIVSILTKHYLLLVITNKRVLARYGLLQMDIVDIRLSKVESIDLERMLPGHIFGYANVVVMGTGQRIIRIPFIKNANDFRKFYNEMVLYEEGNTEAEEIIEKEKKSKDKTKTPTKKKKRT